MKEASLLSLLSKQQEKNSQAYEGLFSSLNLSRMDRFNNLPNTTESSYQALHAAGLASESIVDKLTQQSLLLLVKLAQQDTSRIYLKEDVEKIAKLYGLKFLETRYYKGSQKDMFVDDLAKFQQQLKDITGSKFSIDNVFAFRYYLLGSSRTFDSTNLSNLKAPFIFYHLGAGIYYLLTSYDSWVPKIRKALYWPFASYRRMSAIWLILFCSHVTSLGFIDDPKIYFSFLVLFITFMVFCLSRGKWDMPDELPNWLKRMVYRLVPY